MLYKFTEKQLLIRDFVRDFTAREIAPRDRDMDVKGYDKELFDKMAALGFFGMATPVEYGGSACDCLTCTIAINEVSKGSGSVALALDGQFMISEMLSLHGTEEQKRKYLPIGAAGGMYAFALTEPSGGSDAAAMRTKAVYDPEKDEWIINGSKTWITNAPVAKVMIVMAKTDPDNTHGITAFIVPMDSPGVSVGSHADKMGMRGSITSEVYLEDVKVPSCDVLGQVGKGFKYAMECLDGARITVAAISEGLAEHAMKDAKEHANQRIAFGKPIGKFQGISFKFADMSTWLYASKLMIFNTARMKDAGRRFTMEAAQTKLFCSEVSTRICNDCIQIMGGYGYSREYDVERLWRDTRILEIGEGTSEILRNLIGAKTLADK